MKVVRRYCNILGISVWVSLLNPVAAVTPQFKTALQQDTVKVGKDLELTITATWEGQPIQCLMGEVVIELPAGVERLDSQPASCELVFKDGKPQSTFIYRCHLRPIKDGEYSIEKVEVKFRLTESQKEEWETWKPSKPLQFTATAPLTPKGTGLAALIVAGFLACGVCIYVVASIRYRRATRRESEIDLEAPFMEILADLRSLRIKGDYKAYFGRLESLVRDYLHQKYNIDSSSKDEVMNAVSDGIDPQTAKRLDDVLKLAEDVRFGGAPPLPTDMDRTHSLVNEIFQKNRPASGVIDPEDEIALRDR